MSDVSSNGKPSEGEPLRPITGGDFKQALGKMKESRVYNRQAEALLKMDLDWVWIVALYVSSFSSMYRLMCSVEVSSVVLLYLKYKVNVQMILDFLRP